MKYRTAAETLHRDRGRSGWWRHHWIWNGYQIAPSQATYASPLGSIEFDRRNMRGLGETASASILACRVWICARLISLFSAAFSWLPMDVVDQLFGWNEPARIRFSRRAWVTFRSNWKEFSGASNNARLQLRYDFNKTDLSHLLVPELVSGAGSACVAFHVFGNADPRDTRDKPLDAHRGQLQPVNLGITPSTDRIQCELCQAYRAICLLQGLHSVVFATSVRLGLVKSFDGSFVPTSQLYFSGGGTSLRGFPIDEAGPQRLVPFCNVLAQQTGCVNVNVPVGGARSLF